MMRLFYAPEDWRTWLSCVAGQLCSQACVATIGNFDGVHLGHNALLGRTVARARNLGLPSLAISFEPHPGKYFRREFLPLQTLAQRLVALAQTGLDVLLLLPFTAEFAAINAAEFSRDVLSGLLHVQELFLGYDFQMGRDRADIDVLAGYEHGYRITRVDAVLFHGIPVSSSRIREALARGDLPLANTMLGRAHTVRGVVEHGYGRGGPVLGFPTANQNITAQVMPCPAVYATLVSFPDDADREKIIPGSVCELSQNRIGLFAGSGQSAEFGAIGDRAQGFAAMTSFGKNPTFGGDRLCLESHLLDFQRDIYDRVMDVTFLGKMRDEQTFAGPEALKAQLQADLTQRCFLKNIDNNSAPSQI